MNASSHMVMVIENAHGKFKDQTCNISSSQGIMIPAWVAWCDSSEGLPKEKLANCALARYNIGDITSNVKVDGKSIADLHVIVDTNSSNPADLGVNKKLLLLNNVTEVYTKPFILNWPGKANTFKPAPDEMEKARKMDAGGQGWWVFLKSLPSGNHTVTYNVKVDCTQSFNSPSCTPVPFTENTYHFRVQ